MRCRPGHSRNTYLDIRDHPNITDNALRDPVAAAAVSTFSLGDEISIVGRGNDTTFHAWCAEEKIGLASVAALRAVLLLPSAYFFLLPTWICSRLYGKDEKRVVLLLTCDRWG